MEYIYITLFFIVSIFLVYKSKYLKINEISFPLIIFAFIIKLIYGLAIWYIYTYHYSNKSISDIYKYFEDGRQLAIILKKSPADYFEILKGNLPKSVNSISYYHEMKFWVKPNSYGIYNDNQTIIIITSLLNLISNNQLVLATIYISILSFFATILLYKTLSSFLELKKIFFILIFFLPSIALWTTGLLKETIIFCSLALLLYFAKKLYYRFKLLNIIGFIISCFTLLISKTYLLGFMFPSIICVLFIKLLNSQNVKLFFISTYGLLIIFFITWSLAHNPIKYSYQNKTEVEKQKEYNRLNKLSYNQNVLGKNYNLLEMLRFKQADYKFEARLANAKSLISTKKLDGQLSNFFICIPYGISNGFSRPHIFEINSLLTIYPAFENLLFLIGLLFTFIFTKKLNVDQQIILFSIGTFIFLTFVFLGLLVPVLGNLVRYKAPLLPLLYFCMLLLLDKTKIESFIHKYIRK